MAISLIDHLSKGSLTFLRSDAEEIRRVFPNWENILPEPQTIFLEDESVQPLIGYPILLSRPMLRLNELLLEYVRFEEDRIIASYARQAFDSRGYAAAWDNYRHLLSQVIENSTVSSQGLDFIALFWLYHSLGLSRCLLEIPRRIRRKDLAIGRDHGDSIKYRVFDKITDRFLDLSGDVAKKISGEMKDDSASLVPPILQIMKENLLILTEDHISPDLSELTSYFNGRLQIDSRGLRAKLKLAEDWLQANLASNAQVRAVVFGILNARPGEDATRLLHSPRFLRFLITLADFSPKSSFSEDELQLLDRLSKALKEFEILHTLRKLIIPLEIENGQLISRDRSINTTWVGGPPVLRLSAATRPIDFSAQWVINPTVQRFGLIYDITDFSATLSMLGRAEKQALDDAFRLTSSFQRQINSLASDLNLRLEKYLGDGAFYSGRNPKKLLAMAIRLQRLYPQVIAKGFPFKSGLRIAMNYGEYRLLPLQEGPRLTRYEYFGHGLVELSRLSTGKKTQEIDEFKTYLISQGYPEAQVNKFFAPMMRRDSELNSKIDESRRFYAYINQNHTLVNEGIVATEPFVARLGSFNPLYYAREQGRGFIAFHLAQDDPQSMIGIRKLGIGRFKGLEPIPVYEVVDGSNWAPQDIKEIPPQRLLGAIERLFAKTVAATQSRSANGAGPNTDSQ